uniref:uncharacterized protein LOC120336151 n=1 Tax=Styela clava TaxID=7725 RepID=UPI00193928E5|nr:uncharacterized protein LOC120336151 [Styela clava]
MNEENINDTTNQNIGKFETNFSSTTVGYGIFSTTNFSANGSYYQSNVKGDGVSYAKKDFPSDAFPSDWAVKLGFTLGVVISVLGIIGNSMTIGAYRRNRKLRTSFNFLITNLCALDLFFSAVMIPMHLPMVLLKRELYACDIIGYFYYSSMSSSTINLVCIAINRYVGIVYSKRYRLMFTRESVKYWLIGIWLSAPLLYLPLVIVPTIRWSDSSLRCEPLSDPDVEESILYYRVVLNVILEFLPTIALIIFYRAILEKVKKCRKTVEHYPITNTPSNAPSVLPCAVCSNSRSDCKHDSNSRFPGFSSLRRKTSSSPKCETVIAGEKGDVTEGKKAIIMAYLQVPSTSISPRKNPSTLYKRSPPQTRIMVMEAAGGSDINKVTISGTTSSPNLTKQIQDSVDTPSPSNVSMRGRRLGWCQQRSFSTGDEEIEPEPGMIGDDNSDLREMTSFELKSPVFSNEPKTKNILGGSHVDKDTKLVNASFCLGNDSSTQNCSSSSRFLSPTVICDDTMAANSINTTAQIEITKILSESETNNPVSKSALEIPLSPRLEKLITFSDYKEKCRSLPDNRFLSPNFNDLNMRSQTNSPSMHNSTFSSQTISKTSPPSPDCKEGGSSTSVDSVRRKTRMLKRQSVVEDDSQLQVNLYEKNEIKSENSVQLNVNSTSLEIASKTPETKLITSSKLQITSMTTHLARRPFPSKGKVKEMLSPPEISTASEPIAFSDGVESLVVPTPTSSGGVIGASLNEPISGDVRRAKYAFKPASSSSDKGYASQLEPGFSVDTGVKDPVNFSSKLFDARPESRDEGVGFGVRETGLSKRILYRRGASDSGGKQWFKHFRKSKNWSVTSLKQSKYRIRGSSGARGDTMIKIVIDHATEEVTEEHSAKQQSPWRSHSPETVQDEGILSAKSERSEKVTPNATPQKQNSQNAEKVNNEEKSENRIQRCFRSLWKKLLRQHSSTEKPNDQNYSFRCPMDESNCDMELSNTLSDWPHGCDEGVGSSKASSLTSAKGVSNASSMWSGIVNYPTSPKISHKPMVMLPIPSFPIQSANKEQNDEVGSSGVEKRMCSSPPLYIDSDEGRRKFSEANPIQRVSTFDSIETNSRRGSPDTDIISPKENEALLARRRKMNDSSQFLRVNNICTDGECNISLCDLNSIDLGRRWSGQSDAISIYSGRSLKAQNQKNSSKVIPALKSSTSIVSACSQTRSRKHSKSSSGSLHRRRNSRRPTIYERFSGKKASIVSSSAASSSSRYRRREAERKLAYSGLFICIAFALCILPSSIVDIIRNLTVIYIPANLQLGVVLLSWLHVVINPILYGFMNPQYRKEYRKIYKDARRSLRKPRDRKSGLSHGKSALVKTMRQQTYERPDKVKLPIKIGRKST